MSDQQCDKSHDYAVALEHAWRYFEVHSKQRLTTFNFFLFLAGLASAGLAASLQGSDRFAILGVALGFLLSLAAFVFWKLDQRTSFMIKHAEECISRIEVAYLPEAWRIFASEPARFLAAQPQTGNWKRLWTYGRSFRVSFFSLAAVGACGGVVAFLRFVGWLSWT